MSDGSLGQQNPGGDLDRVLDPHVLDGIEKLSTVELRRLRSECEFAEEGVSYARRLLQGRLDILRAELRRRDDAGDGEAGSVLQHLPDILASETPRAEPLKARAQRVRVPPSAERHEAEIESIVGEADLEDIDERSAEEIRALLDRLSEYERHLSDVRRRLFARIDMIRDELAARYKDGRAAVSDLLAER